MKFRNKKTGNILIAENKETIKLMEKSDNYVPVAENASGKGRGKNKSGSGDPGTGDPNAGDPNAGEPNDDK